ncbi:uncharacterized protein LOC128672100 isoform X2 [Plodia interpunctella]|uniref:uncharacterized protein LOC128672100 isoform X2 n=1 Tax=Plodia interpunctella TaxID=58824 RepID=UPI002367CEBA|nr:uncharacterized protein LOC128672100 isoform X2 [Plodia interpunctella]
MSGSEPWVSRKSLSKFCGRASYSGRTRRAGAGSGPLLALALLSLATHGLLNVAEASQVDRNTKLEDEEESDNAPFAVVVQHDNEVGSAWHCGGSLVSVRSALTSRWCARGRELWVLAAALLSAQHAYGHANNLRRRIARVVFANELGGLLPGEMDDASVVIVNDAWSGATLDIALLEMETPFGSRANVRPILMATASSDCAIPGQCHVAGVVSRGNKALLRIVDLDMVRGDICSDIARHWAAVREYVLCLSGNELCRSDRGAGVVCSGKLCGVMSRSARAGLELGSGCGDVHAAQSLPRWRRFVHCAHIAGSCVRDPECTELCMERQLLPEAAAPAENDTSRTASSSPHTDISRTEPVPASPSTEATKATSESDTTSADTEPPTTNTTYLERIDETTYETSQREKWLVQNPEAYKPPPTRSTKLPPSTAAPAPLSTGAATPVVPVAPRMEFDPSRADFKAGEYGDNAVEYAGVGDDAAASKTGGSSRAPTAADATRDATSAPTRSRPPKSTRFVPPTAENQAAAAEFFPLSSPPVPAADIFERKFTLKEEPVHEEDILRESAHVQVAAQTSACTKSLNILHSPFCFILLLLIKTIY